MSLLLLFSNALSRTWVRINGTWCRATPYVKVSGQWKKARMWRKIDGTWEII